MMKQNFINGATLLGTSIALFGLLGITETTTWNWWVLLFGIFFFLIIAIIEFVSFK